VRKPEGKRPLGRPGHSWEDREIGWRGIHWINLAQGRDQCRRVVNTVMNLQVPSNVGKFLNSSAIGGS
jgi:hypothetical protein